MRTTLVPLALALTVGACSAIRPPEPPVAPPVAPETWTAGPVSEPATAAPAEEPWWVGFGDPRLADLISEAIVANHDLLAAAARVDAAAAQARIAGADLKPKASLAVDGSRRRQNFIGLPIPGAEDRVLSNTSTAVGVSVDVSWEADLWGRLRATRSAAGAAAEAALEDFVAARQSLAAQTAKAWFALLETRQQVEVANETLESRRSTTRQIRRRYENGLRSALDLRQALTAEANAEAELGRRRLLHDNTARQLQLLLSRHSDLDPIVEAAHQTALAEPPPLPRLPAPAELLSRRPDLRAAERRLTSAGFDVAAARAALYPGLVLTGSVGRTGTEVSQLLDGDFSVWSLAERLLQPLFQGGRLRATVHANEARLREIAHQYSARVLSAFAEVETALDADRALAGVEQSIATAERQASAARQLAEERYRGGLDGYLRVLEAQRQETQARGAQLSVRRQRLDARIDLHLALGSGFLYDTPPADRANPVVRAASAVDPEPYRELTRP